MDGLASVCTSPISFTMRDGMVVIAIVPKLWRLRYPTRYACSVPSWHADRSIFRIAARPSATARIAPAWVTTATAGIAATRIAAAGIPDLRLGGRQRDEKQNCRFQFTH